MTPQALSNPDTSAMQDGGSAAVMRWLAVSGLLVAAAAIVSYLWWDRAVAQWVHTRDAGFRDAAGGIAHLGHGLVVLAALAGALVVAVALRNARWRAWTLGAMCSVAAAGVAVNLLKIMCGRYRPLRLLDDGDYGFEPFRLGYEFASMPSGHASVLGALCGCLILWRPRLTPLWALAVAIVGAGRVLENAHYISDVLVGMYLGAAVAVLCPRLLPQRMRFRQVYRPAAES